MGTLAKVARSWNVLDRAHHPVTLSKVQGVAQSSSPAVVSFTDGYSESAVLDLVRALDQPFPGNTQTFRSVEVEYRGLEGDVTVELGMATSLYVGTRTWRARGPGYGFISITQAGDSWSGAILGQHEIFFTVSEKGKVAQVIPNEEEDPSPPQAQASTGGGGGTTAVSGTGESTLSSPAMQSASAPPSNAAEIIDLLVVFDPVDVDETEAMIRSATVNGTSIANDAIARVGNYAFRLRRIEVIDWDTDSPDKVCKMRTELVDDSDGNADGVPALRDAVGADIVLGIVPDADFGGCAVTPETPGPNTAHSAYATTAFGSTGNSIRHELGHLLGIDHDWQVGCDDSVSYACGYSWPNNTEAIQDPICTNGSRLITLPGQNPFVVQTGPESFRTIMSKLAFPTVGGTRFDAVRINAFSDFSENRAWIDVCDGPGPYWPVRLHPLGTIINSTITKTADAAARLRETYSDVADYRSEVVPFSEVGGSVLSTPTPHSHIGPPSQPGIAYRTFSWTATSNPSNDYWLEVFELGSGGSELYNAPVAGTSVSVGITTDEPLAARLWTNQSGDSGAPLWSFRNYRFNIDQRFVSCDDELVGALPASDACAQVCTESGGTITCDIHDGGTTDPHLFGLTPGIDSSTNQTPQVYDFVFYGETSSGNDFCCAFHDESATISSIRLDGGPRMDFISVGIRPHGHVGLDVEARGYGSGDIILGSDSASPSFFEYLRGYNGADFVAGDAGNEVLGGGFGGDQLFGHAGQDVLWGGNDSVIDTLDGGYGDNLICVADGEDVMYGATQPDNSTTVRLYVSQSSPNPVSSDTRANSTDSKCGHSVIGPWSQAGCGQVNLTSPPAECAVLGVPQ